MATVIECKTCEFGEAKVLTTDSCGCSEYYCDLTIDGKLLKSGDTIYVKDRHKGEWLKAIFDRVTDDKYVYAKLEENETASDWRYITLEPDKYKNNEEYSMKASTDNDSIDSIGVFISILHWDNGCKHCPIIKNCKSKDGTGMQCHDIWTQYIKDELKNFED